MANTATMLCFRKVQVVHKGLWLVADNGELMVNQSAALKNQQRVRWLHRLPTPNWARARDTTIDRMQWTAVAHAGLSP